MAGSLFSASLNTSTAVQYLRWILYVMFFLIVIGGCAVLGIGIWTLTTEYGGRQLSGLIGAHLYLIDSYLLIICGCLILFVTVLGVCGAHHESRCMLELHLCIMAFLSLTLVVGGGLGFAFRDELEVGVKEKMVDSLTESYGVGLDDSDTNKEITETWDLVQKQFKCCGAYGNINSSESWALYKTKSRWYLEDYNSNSSYVPKSCCKPSFNTSICTGQTAIDAPPSIGPPVSGRQAQRQNYLYTVGCYDRMVETLEANGMVIGVAAITVATFMFIELVVCICLYRHFRTKRRRLFDFKASQYHEESSSNPALWHSAHSETT